VFFMLKEVLVYRKWKRDVLLCFWCVQTANVLLYVQIKQARAGRGVWASELT
jgi:hypothetical protein